MLQLHSSTTSSLNQDGSLILPAISQGPTQTPFPSMNHQQIQQNSSMITAQSSHLNNDAYKQNNGCDNHNDLMYQSRNSILNNLSLLSNSSEHGSSSISTASSNSSSGSSSSVENSLDNLKSCLNIPDNENILRAANKLNSKANILSDSWFSESYANLKRPIDSVYSEILNQTLNSNESNTESTPSNPYQGEMRPTSLYQVSTSSPSQRNSSLYPTNGSYNNRISPGNNEPLANPLETLVNLSNSQISGNSCLNLTNSIYSKVNTGTTSNSDNYRNTTNMDSTNSLSSGLFSMNNFIMESNYSGNNHQHSNGLENNLNDVRECVSCGVVSASVWRYDTTGHYLCNSCTYLSKNQHSNNLSSEEHLIPSTSGQTTLAKSGKSSQKYAKQKPYPNNSESLFNASNSTNNKRPPFKRTGLICSNCETNQTTLWRRNLDAQPVCNACGLYQKLHGRCRPVTMRKDAIQTRKRKSKKRRDSSTMELYQFPNTTERNSERSSSTDILAKQASPNDFSVLHEATSNDRQQNYNDWTKQMTFCDNNETNAGYAKNNQLENWSTNLYNSYYNSISSGNNSNNTLSNEPDFDTIVSKNISSMFSGGPSSSVHTNNFGDGSQFPSTNLLMSNLKNSFPYCNSSSSSLVNNDQR